MAYYGNTQIKEAVGLNPTATRAIQDSSLGRSGRLRSFQDGVLGGMSPGKLRAFQDGSLGATSGRLRAFRDGSLGAGCAGTDCGGMGLPLYVDGQRVDHPLTIRHGTGAATTETKVTLDLSPNSAGLSEFKQALAFLLDRSQTVSANISKPVWDDEASKLMRDFVGTLQNTFPEVYKVYSGGGDTPLVLDDGTPTYNGAAAVLAAITNASMSDDPNAQMVAQGFPISIATYKKLLAGGDGVKPKYKGPKKGATGSNATTYIVGGAAVLGVLGVAYYLYHR